MDIKRDVECLHAFPEWLVSWILEVDAIGVAVDHRPRRSLGRALERSQLVSGGGRVLHGEVGEPGITVSSAMHFRG